MVIRCKGLYFDEENEASHDNSTRKRAEGLPANEKTKKTRGSRANRVVPVANADAVSSHQLKNGVDDQSKNTSKANDDDRDTDIEVDLEPAKLEEKPGPGNSENSELSLPQVEGNHGSDFMEPHQKIEISGNQKTHRESISPLLLRIRMHCSCGGCTKKMQDIFKGFKGVKSIKIHSDKNIVQATGTMDRDKFVVYLKEKLRRNVEVIPAQNDETGASPTQKDTAGDRHIANLTDNASRKEEVCPDMKGKQNVETELTLPQPRKRDRNDNEVTGMVHLKIRMHCHEGCIPQTQKTAMEFTGVKSVKVDASKHLVIVVGTINVTGLVAYLKEKLNRSVEVVHVQNDNVACDSREVEVTKLETLKEPAAACANFRNHKDVEIKKEVKKEVKHIKIKKEDKDVKEEGKNYHLRAGKDGGTTEDKEGTNGKEGGVDKIKEAKGHGYISHVGKKHKELEMEGNRQTYDQNYGGQVYLGYGPSNYDNITGYHDCGIQMFSDENPNSCTIM